MDRADTFTGRPFPEKGAGKRFSVLLLLIIMEKIPFIRVYGNDTLLTIGVPYPEFAGTDLLLYADDLAHGAAAVTAALANEGHNEAPLFCWWIFGRDKHSVDTSVSLHATVLSESFRKIFNIPGTIILVGSGTLPALELSGWLQ